MSDFMAMACTAGRNTIRNNTYCRLSPGPFCKGFGVHHCTNTSSVFSGNGRHAESSIDPRKPGDKKTMRYASSMRWRANPATG